MKVIDYRHPYKLILHATSEPVGTSLFDSITILFQIFFSFKVSSKLLIKVLKFIMSLVAIIYYILWNRWQDETWKCCDNPVVDSNNTWAPNLAVLKVVLYLRYVTGFELPLWKEHVH